MFDISGKQVLTGENTDRIFVPDLARGIYILRLDGEKQQKVLKE